ncbi:class I SAM-dependent methyltransferase [Oricola cellulosilytica]|uniref:Class I SAM-dependent methyltransferase n=1 Tax=Oricola cellulosilytica TaxID=1429082 RepID=A0A4V2MNY7_9HYPH|nr:class I SAM-dependent methyltransferase [Oricola cellulosilytica]TCD15327.1 class I SAM-dependent methyltransferase [Oricola cellulosilytica]
MTNPLAGRIRRLIETLGPISVSDYMAMCLFDPAEGYYTTREPFGTGGDFTTAPEISQMFGEIVGAWLVHAWQTSGKPSPFALAEIGPGRGTLMRDILRTAKLAPEFLATARVVLVEASPRLREIQRQTLSGVAGDCAWIDTMKDLPPLPLFLVANELFDAIPLRQFEKAPQGWFERKIAVDAAGEFTFTLKTPLLDPSFLPPGAASQPAGAIFEYAPAREAMAGDIAAHLATHDGVALIIDYGHAEPGFGDTLQAVENHRYVSVLENPGRSDLTSHVDFASLARAAQAHDASALPVITQGEFLLSLGLAERAGTLGAGKAMERRQAIREAAERLAGGAENQMGSLFKVLCLTGVPRTLPPFA